MQNGKVYVDLSRFIGRIVHNYIHLNPMSVIVYGYIDGIVIFL